VSPSVGIGALLIGGVMSEHAGEPNEQFNPAVREERRRQQLPSADARGD
jgi:hypothetical protein